MVVWSLADVLIQMHDGAPVVSLIRQDAVGRFEQVGPGVDRHDEPLAVEEHQLTRVRRARVVYEL